jgi:transcriptional regulator with XRE-family HTH domain
MQDKSLIKCSIPERLQNLRLKKQLTWERLAVSLDLTVSMLFQVKAGNRNLSDKALYRLEQAEIAAGLRPPPSPKASSSKLENSDLDTGLNRLRAKLSVLDSKTQERILKAFWQILDAQRTTLGK